MTLRHLPQQVALLVMGWVMFIAYACLLSPAETSWTPLQISAASRDASTWRLLPGVGPVLASRLAAAAPFQDPAALQAVDGIGPATASQLVPHINWSTRLHVWP